MTFGDGNSGGWYQTVTVTSRMPVVVGLLGCIEHVGTVQSSTFTVLEYPPGRGVWTDVPGRVSLPH